LIARQEIGCFSSQKERGNALCCICKEAGNYTFELIQIGEQSAKHHFENLGANLGQVEFGFGRCVPA
jgi:hypothetical protein